MGYVPFAMAHYVENRGDEPLLYLEMFRASRFVDVSLQQWMALTPPELVQAHLNLDQTVTGALQKEKLLIVSGRDEQALQQRLQTLLRENRLCVIATVMPDGTPNTAVMHYSMADAPLRLFFSADERSTKVHNAVNNGKAAVTVGWSKVSPITAQMRGEIREITDPAELASAKATHYAMNPDLQQSEKDPHTVFLVFTPSWGRYADLSMDPPLVEEAEGRW